MNLRKVSLYLVCLIIVVLSCKKDDDGGVAPVEIRDRAEQQKKDIDSLNKYLESHYYNSAHITSLGTDVSISDIVINKLPDGKTEADVPVGHTLLKTAVGSAKTTTHANTTYEYYVLKLNQGGGSESPKFCDKIRLNYEGFTLDNNIFDYSVNPFVGNLIRNGVNDTGLIAGWSKVMPYFNVAKGFIENPDDGTINFPDKGVGIMFLPSGLAYFSSPLTGIPAYSPIIFKFELLQMEENDHDGDGVPSHLEDLPDSDDKRDADFIVNFEDLTDTKDDDTDGDSIPDYLDIDDDGDGILTKDEIIKTTITKTTLEGVKSEPLQYNQILLNKITKEQNGSYTGTIITFKDSDPLKVPPFDYLDKNF